MVRWDKLDDAISTHFKVKTALYLPSWQAYHVPTEVEKTNIIRMANTLDTLQELLGKPIIVHGWIRPKVANIPGHRKDGGDYNAARGGAKASAHIKGLAVDFHAVGMSCDAVRRRLLPHLEELRLRMEDNPGSNWVHVDLMATTGKLFFKP